MGDHGFSERFAERVARVVCDKPKQVINVSHEPADGRLVAVMVKLVEVMERAMELVFEIGAQGDGKGGCARGAHGHAKFLQENATEGGKEAIADVSDTYLNDVIER